MLRRVAFACLVSFTLIAPAFAQDGDAPPPSGDGPRAPRPPARKLEFAGPTPEGWKAPEPVGRRFQLHLATPDGAEVTVLPMRGQREFGDYRRSLLRAWTTADGAPLGDADQVVEIRKAADPEIQIVEQAGTRTQRDGAQEGMKLIAVHVRQGEDRWSVWLLGPAAAVDAQREAFLKWIDTARPAAAPAPPPSEGAPPEPF